MPTDANVSSDPKEIKIDDKDLEKLKTDLENVLTKFLATEQIVNYGLYYAGHEVDIPANQDVANQLSGLLYFVLEYLSYYIKEVSRILEHVSSYADDGEKKQENSLSIAETLITSLTDSSCDIEDKLRVKYNEVLSILNKIFANISFFLKEELSDFISNFSSRINDIEKIESQMGNNNGFSALIDKIGKMFNGTYADLKYHGAMRFLELYQDVFVYSIVHNNYQYLNDEGQQKICKIM